MHGVGCNGKVHEFITKRSDHIQVCDLSVNYLATESLSQDGVLYKRLMHINEMAQWPWPWAVALMTMSLVQCINVVPWHCPVQEDCDPSQEHTLVGTDPGFSTVVSTLPAVCKTFDLTKFPEKSYKIGIALNVISETFRHENQRSVKLNLP